MVTSATVMAVDLNERAVRAGNCTRVCSWHGRCRHARGKRNSACCKSDQQKPLHDVYPPWIA